MTAIREKKLEDALAQFIKPIRGLPFEVVIQALCSVGVIQFNPKDKKWNSIRTTKGFTKHTEASPKKECKAPGLYLLNFPLC